MNCSNCNAWVPEGDLFCSQCGQKMGTAAPGAPEKKVCPNCGTETEPGDMFCGVCGARVAAPVNSVPAGPAPVVQKPKKSKKRAGFKPGRLWLLLGAIAVVAVIVILVISLASGGTGYDYAVYIKDGELQYLNMPKGKDPIELTTRFVDDGDYDNEDLSYIGGSSGSLIRMSADGKRLFYPDRADIDEGEFTLYYRQIKNSRKEPVKIDSGIYGYELNENGTLVTYVKNGNLYQHDLSEKTKIAGDVAAYRVSEDGKTLLYLVMEGDETAGDLYVKKYNKDAEKIASDVSGMRYCDKDITTVLYFKDDSLYIKRAGKEAEKIASDVYSVVMAYDSGSCYFIREKEPEITSWSVIEDDMGDEYDYYQGWLEEETLTNPLKTLCYYNGKETAVVTEGLMDYHYDYNSDMPVLVYETLADGELPKIKLSEYVNGSSGIYTLLWEAMEEEAKVCVAMEAVSAELDLDRIEDVLVAEDGKTLYIGTDYDSEDYTVMLYKVTLANSQVQTSELLDEDVYPWSYEIINKSSVAYFKEVNEDYEGELYLNGELIDDDVYRGNCAYNEHNGCLYYYVDYNASKHYGSLTYFDGKKSVTVKDDVAMHRVTPGGEVLFLYDYSLNSYRGELWIQDGRKLVKLDDDVVNILTVD